MDVEIKSTLYQNLDKERLLEIITDRDLEVLALMMGTTNLITTVNRLNSENNHLKLELLDDLKDKEDMLKVGELYWIPYDKYRNEYEITVEYKRYKTLAKFTTWEEADNKLKFIEKFGTLSKSNLHTLYELLGSIDFSKDKDDFWIVQSHDSYDVGIFSSSHILNSIDVS